MVSFLCWQMKGEVLEILKEMKTLLLQQQSIGWSMSIYSVRSVPDEPKFMADHKLGAFFPPF